MGKKLFLILTIIPASLLIMFLSIGNLKMYYKRQNMQVELDYFKNEAEQISQQKEMLEARILASQMPEQLEKTAREDLNLQKAGEKVVAFPLTNDNSTSSIIQPSITESKSFWQRIGDLFR